MPLVHLYRRTGPTPIDIGGTVYQFKPNEAGEVVCEVPEGSALLRMLDIREGFKLHASETPAPSAAPAANAAAEQVDAPPADDEVHAHVLVGEDGTKLDLRVMTDAELQAFAKANKITVPAKSKGDTLRNQIVVGLGEQAAADEAAQAGEGAQP